MKVWVLGYFNALHWKQMVTAHREPGILKNAHAIARLTQDSKASGMEGDL